MSRVLLLTFQGVCVKVLFRHLDVTSIGLKILVFCWPNLVLNSDFSTFRPLTDRISLLNINHLEYIDGVFF